jgi:hypothetical protein
VSCTGCALVGLTDFSAATVAVLGAFYLEALALLADVAVGALGVFGACLAGAVVADFAVKAVAVGFARPIGLAEALCTSVKRRAFGCVLAVGAGALCADFPAFAICVGAARRPACLAFVVLAKLVGRAVCRDFAFDALGVFAAL